MIEKQNRQWQDNGKTMTINMTKKDKNHKFLAKFIFLEFQHLLSFFWFLCHVFVMFHCFPLCFHDSSVWCVMFNCFSNSLMFVDFFLHFLLFFVTFPWVSSLFACFLFFRWFSSRLHWFSSIVSNVFSLFSSVLIDLSMVLLL